MWRTIVCFLFVNSLAVSKDLKDAIKEREKIIKNELNMMLGSHLVLSDNEQKVNEIMMELKHRDLDASFDNPAICNISKHFFDYKEEVKKTELFKLIKQMPKGALLHVHDTGILGPDYVLELTYLPDLSVCFEEDDIRFLFSENSPNTTCGTQWQEMKEARYSSGDVDKFDAELRKHFTIVIDNPREVYTDINIVWKKLQQYFITTSSIFCYKPVWEQYFYDTLKELRKDNVMYLELRSVLPQLYDLKGNVYDAVATADAYKEVLDRFVSDYPDFFGAKLIYAPLRSVNANTVKEYLDTARQIKRSVPDLFAGFDLVGQEDLGVPLKDFLPELVAASDEFEYFFHAGETNWYGSSSDENIIDAIVLGTRRLGHAFALVKHPLLQKEVKERDIAVEVNVISNSVLKLVDDVRNHPLVNFLAQDLPVVLSSDDPGVWEADPLSHDFYVTFVGIASRHADLRLLKSLALNSLVYSTANNKDKLLHEFEIRWTKFIDEVVKDKW